MSQSIIAPQPKSKQNFPSIETNCKEGETKMLTAVPAEGYLALRQHRIILCAAPIFFQGCVSLLPCPHLRVGLFVYRLQRVPLSERVSGRLCSAFCCRQRQTKTPTAAAVGFGSIIICGCSQRTAKRMIQQHTGDNIPIGVHRTVSDRLRYPLLSYQLFQRIHLLFQKVKRYLWIDLVIQLRSINRLTTFVSGNR